MGPGRTSLVTLDGSWRRTVFGDDYLVITHSASSGNVRHLFISGLVDGDFSRLENFAIWNPSEKSRQLRSVKPTIRIEMP